MKYLSTPDTLHGVFLEIFSKGVVLMGDSGCGKSDCALALLSRNHKFIADDIILVQPKKEKVMGYCSAALQNLLHHRALGFVDISSIFGKGALLNEKPIELIISFISGDNSPLLQPKLETKYLFDIPIPHWQLPLAFTQNSAILVETAVKMAFSTQSSSVQRMVNEQIYTQEIND